MSSGLNYARAKRYARTRVALHNTPPETDTPPRGPVSLRGWRLTDGVKHPVTVTNRGISSVSSTKEKANA